MAIPAHIDHFHSVAVAIAAIPGDMTPESIASACGVELSEIACAIPGVRELQGYPVGGAFSIISLRDSLTNRAEPPALTLTPRAGVRLYQSDLERDFTFGRDLIHIDPHVPPEGTVTFLVQRGSKDLRFEFTRKSRVLRELTVRPCV
ncbi:hypothetical protein ACFVUS_27100 [Nocardia sp. NPDC058058]|uniref:hypothetical protein n=1 Tax=Nocardia sp. NPDC058058 TaxID=3346317 RepID=UPI0036DC2645